MELKRPTLKDNIILSGLLIVPYGIETKDMFHGVIPQAPFNRTLWN